MRNCFRRYKNSQQLKYCIASKQSHFRKTKKGVSIWLCVTIKFWVLCDYMGTWRISHRWYRFQYKNFSDLKTVFVICKMFINRDKENQSEALDRRKTLDSKSSQRKSENFRSQILVFSKADPELEKKLKMTTIRKIGVVP